MTLKRTFSARLKRITAAFLLFSLLNQLLAPAAAWALTSGPTAPEATSFEPVDTTDMVNLLTGDLAYTLPLLEVPGPEGGYPLSLSYHAGIQPNEDASWVGLGWTLNPGAINRSVNGFPDDWYGAQSSRRDFWEGGTQTGTRVGITVPLGGLISNVSLGLSFSNDTYQGHSMGWDAGVGIGIPNSPFSLGIGMGMNTNGQFFGSAQAGGEFGHFSAGMGVSIGGGNGVTPFASMGVSTSSADGKSKYGIGLNAFTDFQSISAGFELTRRSEALGDDGKSRRTRSSSIGGFSASTQNSRAGAISTQTKTTSVNLLLFSYSKQKTRYWSNEREDSFMFGALYPSDDFYLNIPDNGAYDAYSLQDENQSIVDQPDPTKLQGGAFPSYDIYQVAAQGLGGAMRPYRFDGEAHQQNRWERINSNTTVKSVEYISNNMGSGYPEFRFENDFSNNYIQNYPDFPYMGSELIFYTPPNSGPQFDDYEWMMGFNGRELAGSKHISYFVTKWDGTVWNYGSDKKFITPVVNGGLNRRAHTNQAQAATHIAGFSITNENGVTYHYNLPAYSYGEEMYQELTDRSGGLKFNRQVKTEGYAYTWYLTAITGPDYVDRGTAGQLDAEDYGQWISFEYGKWSDKFVWRNPSEGYHKDDDGTFRNVSMGRKEVYYLNAIRTRSHAALFEKDVRLDAKGASPEVFNKNYVGSPVNAESDYQNEGIYNVNSSQSMRLDRIYLMNNADASFVTPSRGGSGSYIPSGRTVYCSDCELHSNVLDKNDVDAAGRTALEAKSLRVIDFNYDYSLASRTVNSYAANNAASKSGKLTLTSVKFRGKGGADLLPSVDFEYGPDAADTKRASGSLTSTGFTTSSGTFEPGDLLEMDNSSPVYCGVVLSKTLSGSNWFYTLRNSSFSSSGTYSVRTTKNPPYHKDRYDYWGMYKSDYIVSSNENLSRMTSAVSNKGTDVWSLRKVKTGLGAEIKIAYEGDTYSKSVLNRNRSLVVSNFTSQGSNNFYFSVNPEGQNLNDLFKVGDELDLMLLKQIGSSGSFYTLNSASYPPPPKITAISGNYIYADFGSSMGTAVLYNGGTGTIRTGNLKAGGIRTYYGGGLRVSKVTVDNLSGVRTGLNYDYRGPDNWSSGVTSYEPVGMDTDNAAQSVSTTDNNVRAAAAKSYRRMLYQDMSRLLSIMREVPAPGVMYEFVSITTDVFNSVDNQTRGVPGRSRLQFEVFRESMVGKQDATPRRSAPRDPGNSSFYTRNLVLRKFVSNIGALKRSIVYDAYGSVLKETINHYLHDGLEKYSHDAFMSFYEQRLAQYKKQGLIKERYSEIKAVWTGSGSTSNDVYWDIKATLSAREEYPAIQTGQTFKDYQTGITTSTVDLAFDFYSGAVTQRVITDAYGNRFMQEMIPAYRKYPEMGLKTSWLRYKNMLNQETANYTYKVDANNNKLALVSAGVQLWGTQTPALNLLFNPVSQNDAASEHGVVWRKTEAYSWMPEGQTADGTTAISNFADFDYEGQAQHSAWKRIASISLYDVFSKPQESVDMNGIWSASRMGYNNSKVVIAGSNTRYNEITYAGAEDGYLTDSRTSTRVSPGQGNIVAVMAHTGVRSLEVTPGSPGYYYSVPLSSINLQEKDYYASVWVKPQAGGAVTGARLYYKTGNGSKVYASTSFSKQAAGWYLLELKIPSASVSNPGDAFEVGVENNGTVRLYFDDFRFQPMQSAVNTYVYDLFSGELTAVLDNSNLFTKYEYDAAGRLVKVYREVLGKATTPLVKETVYNYHKTAN